MAPVIARLFLPAIIVAFAVGCAGRSAPTPPVAAVIGAEERGLASWYGHPYHGRRTASGEIYDMHQMTAAHRTLPFSTWLHVENLTNGQTTRVRVNDRGPFIDGRVLDVSRAAGAALGLLGPGTAPVRLRIIPPPAGTGTGPVFTVQLGAFDDEAAAAGLQRALAAAGVESRVVLAEEGARVLYRVRAGRFTTRPDADAHADQLTGRGFRALVVTD